MSTADDAKDAAERLEETLRREGRWCRNIGIGAAATIVFASLMYQFATHHEPPVVLVLAALAFASVTYLHGMREKATQPNRAGIRAAFAAQADNSRRLDNVEKALIETCAAVDAMAQHLPGALARENWQGFNSAVREGLGPTGTHGPGHTSRGMHLGLVSPEKP
jgi:uncharacterized membrane protein